MAYSLLVYCFWKDEGMSGYDCVSWRCGAFAGTVMNSFDKRPVVARIVRPVTRERWGSFRKVFWELSS